LPGETSIPSNPSLSDEENALLNLEVTPEIENLLYEHAKEKGSLPEPLVEEEIDDAYAEEYEGPDHERNLDNAIPLLDEYFRVSDLLDKAIDEFGWGSLSSRRAKWWSLFKEEVDFNWTKLDVWEEKVDKRLHQLSRLGKQPTDEQWQKTFEIRGNLVRYAKALEKNRWAYTSSIFKKALKVNADCRAFWKSPKGQAINKIRQERRDLYKQLTTRGEDKTCPLDYVGQYFQLKSTEFSRGSYLSSNDNAGVDDPVISALQKDTMEGYLDTHLLEEWLIEKGDIYWEKWYDRWLQRKENYLAGISAQMHNIERYV